MYLRLEHIDKSFGHEAVLRRMNLEMAAHQTMSILGASGCGKTTLLKIIAGIINADNGTISLGGKNISTLPPNKRNIVYLSQEPLLFPHLNTFENIAFGLRLRKVDEAIIHEKTTALIKRLG